MSGPGSMDQRMDQYLKRVDQIIADSGWLLQGVFPVKPGDHTWAYTVGLYQWQHPELFMVGIPHGLAATLLNQMGERVRAGEAFRHGQRADDVLTGPEDQVMTIEFVEVPPIFHGEWFGLGRRYYRDKRLGPFTAIQGVWPDSHNHLPWEPGFEQQFRFQQPVLGTQVNRQGA